MYYSETVKKALKIAYEAHQGQEDAAGYPYVFHSYHLAESFFDEDSVVVALLHDVVEDASVTIEDLKNAGFNDRVLQAISLLTHNKGSGYADYVERVSENPLARRVKLADLKHNCDVSRGADSDYFKKKRRDCYYPAMRLLIEKEGFCPLENERIASESPLIPDGFYFIRDERLKDPSLRHDLLKRLEKEEYREDANESHPMKKEALCVCPATKKYIFVPCGVSVARSIGEKAISLDDFLTIFRIITPDRCQDDPDNETTPSFRS